MSDGHFSRPTAPSPWVVAHAGLIVPGADVLDLACGAGRHTRFLLEKGFRVMAVDINISGLDDLIGHPGGGGLVLRAEGILQPVDGEAREAEGHLQEPEE